LTTYLSYGECQTWRSNLRELSDLEV